MKYFIIATICFFAAVDAVSVFYGGDCSSNKCDAAANLLCANKVCQCAADSAYKGEYVGNSDKADAASAKCEKKCDAAKFKCGTQGECDTTDAKAPFCKCKSGYVYDASKAAIAKQIEANFNCKEATKDAECKSAKATGTVTWDKTSKKCSCASGNTLTYKKEDGKYDCTTAKSPSGSAAVAISAISVATLALFSKML